MQYQRVTGWSFLCVEPWAVVSHACMAGRPVQTVQMASRCSRFASRGSDTNSNARQASAQWAWAQFVLETEAEFPALATDCVECWRRETPRKKPFASWKARIWPPAVNLDASGVAPGSLRTPGSVRKEQRRAGELTRQGWPTDYRHGPRLRLPL